MVTLLRVVLSFATVGALLWLFARASRGRLGSLLGGTIGGSRNEPISVLDRCQLTKGTAVAVVRAGRRHLLLGVGDSGVQLLAEGDDLVGVPSDALPSPPDAVEIDPVPAIDLAADRHPPDAHQPDGHQLDLQRARTRLLGAASPNPPRTSLIDALREKTVRRS